MGESGEIWGLVLAAGEGSRLAGWARDGEGRPAPKQFCALGGERTLLEQTHERIRRSVARSRTVTVVAAAHRRHWSGLLERPLADNLVVQPENRGTAAGILLPLLEILQRDPNARVVICPSDHAVADERRFGAALTSAFAALERPLDRILLLGIEPDTSDGEYGWIVPAGPECSCGRPGAVERFVEKPDRALAEQLGAAGAVWNSFWMVTRASSLAALYRERQPELWRTLGSARERERAGQANALAEAYRTLPALDFSRALLQGAERRLALVVVPPCGWTDLGTPARLLRHRERQRSQMAPTRGERLAAGLSGVGRAALGLTLDPSPDLALR